VLFDFGRQQPAGQREGLSRFGKSDGSGGECLKSEQEHKPQGGQGTSRGYRHFLWLLDVAFPLTPALSPEERENARQSPEQATPCPA